MYYISVEKNFSAAHALRGYKGKCERLHGHNWKVKAVISGSILNKIGMIIDFSEARAMLDEVIIKLDHQYLNEVGPFKKINPTAENIAAYIHEGLKKKLSGYETASLHEVTVWESEASSVTVRY